MNLTKMMPNSVLQFEENKPLAPLTTLQVGGSARFFVEVKSLEEMAFALKEAKRKNIPFHIIGRGSNTLFDDRGFDGLVIANKIDFCNIVDNKVYVGAGFNFSLLGFKTAQAGLSGLEFASGIPASVGGALFMNAGAQGGEASSHLLDAAFITSDGEMKVFKKEDLKFDYRYSSFHEMQGSIVSCTFLLSKEAGARKKQKELIDYRLKTQPYKDHSAGCVFRNPAECPAGRIIEQCGLKGLSIGGAEVSTMHANFIVNKKGATQKEILALALEVKEKVKEQKGIDLELELRVIPYNGHA